MSLNNIIETKAAELMELIHREAGMPAKRVVIELLSPDSATFHAVEIEFDKRIEVWAGGAK